MTWVFVAFSPLFTKANKGITMDIGRLYKEHYNESHDAALGAVFSAGFDAGVASVAPQPDAAVEQPAVPVPAGSTTLESSAAEGGQAPSVENTPGQQFSVGGPDSGFGEVNLINGGTNADQSSVAQESGATSGSGEAATQEPAAENTKVPEASGDTVVSALVGGVGTTTDGANMVINPLAPKGDGQLVLNGGGPEAAAAG